VEEFKRACWTRTRGPQVGGAGEEKEGCSAQVLEYSRHLHGDSRWSSVSVVLLRVLVQCAHIEAYSKGLQFYTELTDLMKKLQGDVRTYISGRVVEREALIAKIEGEKRSSAAPPPLAAKPPLPPPPVPAPNLDAAFTSMSLRDHPSAPQQWQHTTPSLIPPQVYGGAPASQYPSPPPRQPQQPYGNGSPAIYTTSPSHSHTPPTSQQHQQHPPAMSGFMPPPPARPIQSSFSPSSASSQVDPYASLGMFASPAPYAGQHQSMSSTKAPPPPPPPQQQSQNNFMQQQQHYPQGYLTPQALLQLAQQHTYQASPPQEHHRTTMAQQQQQFEFPPPPPQLNYQYGTQQGNQQQQRNSQQGFPPHQLGGGGYGRGY
jgi:hypothetical protein